MWSAISEGTDHQAVREKDSVPFADKLIAKPKVEQRTIPPQTRLGQAVKHQLVQHTDRCPCLTEPRAQIENHPVERAIRPLKIGARNWLFVGHPAPTPNLIAPKTVVD